MRTHSVLSVTFMHVRIDTPRFACVPEAEKARFAAFVEAHPLGELVADGLRVPYLSGGTGERIVLVLTAAHATPFQAYDSVLRLEAESRVLVVDVGECSSLDEVARCADRVLDAEGLGHVVAFGQSISGILAQAYAMRSASRLDGMVLAQTVPPKRESNRIAVLHILRVLPMGLLRRLIKRKLGRLADVDVPPEVKARRAMSLALLSDTVDNVLTKKRLMNAIRLIFEFNREEDYGAVAREAWRGRVLLFTSEDDPGFADVDRIVRALPQTEVHVSERCRTSGACGTQPRVLRSNLALSTVLLTAWLERSIAAVRVQARRAEPVDTRRVLRCWSYQVCGDNACWRSPSDS